MSQTALPQDQTPDIAAEEAMRADFYDFLSALLAAPPDADLLARCAALSGDGSELGRAIGAVAAMAGATSEKQADREYHALFIGLGRGELMPFGSYYLTGFLHEKPLALLREDMARLEIVRAPHVKEPEDSIASLLEMMAGLIRGRFGAPADLDTQKTFFNKHIAPWAGHFFADLERAENAAFYAPVGAAGRLFIAIEAEAFRMG